MGCNLKTRKLLNCALIGVCAVIRLNTVFLMDLICRAPEYRKIAGLD